MSLNPSIVILLYGAAWIAGIFLIVVWVGLPFIIRHHLMRIARAVESMERMMQEREVSDARQRFTGLATNPAGDPDNE